MHSHTNNNLLKMENIDMYQVKIEPVVLVNRVKKPDLPQFQISVKISDNKKNISKYVTESYFDMQKINTSPSDNLDWQLCIATNQITNELCEIRIQFNVSSLLCKIANIDKKFSIDIEDLKKIAQNQIDSTRNYHRFH